MDYRDFCKIGFSMGMGFDILSDDHAHVLASCDFETGECEDSDGKKFPLEDVKRFFYYDGTPLTVRS